MTDSYFNPQYGNADGLLLPSSEFDYAIFDAYEPLEPIIDVGSIGQPIVDDMDDMGPIGEDMGPVGNMAYDYSLEDIFQEIIDNLGSTGDMGPTGEDMGRPILDTQEEKEYIVFSKDEYGFGYVGSAGTEDYFVIANEVGSPIGDDTFPGWSLISAGRVGCARSFSTFLCTSLNCCWSCLCESWISTRTSSIMNSCGICSGTRYFAR